MTIVKTADSLNWEVKKKGGERDRRTRGKRTKERKKEGGEKWIRT